ncbi:hypothetical protein [Streptomyces sp. NRRL F-4474]|uniref:hypothetical protein n=1 Tax=Streptomyces sp. NRRL F-4474 TaxID=1463851 RepID=UPI0004C869E8|nr:hypothetical protein [Streptomyces sp. NRRL F-4474]
MHRVRAALADHRPARSSAEAVEELRRSETDRKAFPTYLTWLLRSLGEPGDGALLRWLPRPDSPATTIQRGQGRHLRRAAPELVDAMELSGDPSYAPPFGARAWTAPIAGRLSEVTGTDPNTPRSPSPWS